MNTQRTPAGLYRRRMLGISATAAALIPLSGCGSGEPSYYTLTPQPGISRAGGPPVVEVRKPSVAAYLDRDTIVRNDRDHQLTLAEGNSWASPLAEMIGRNLALDLSQRLPGSSVSIQDTAISIAANALVELDVSSFMENAQGMAELTASLAVYRRGNGLAASRFVHLTAAPADQSINALVAALSQLLGQVADMAAAALRALPPLVAAG